MREIVPSETETIAAKRAAREELKTAKKRKRILQRKFWWTKYHAELLIVLVLQTITLFVVHPVWNTNAPDIPYSGPIVPLLARGISALGVELSHAYQVVHIGAFLLFPLSMYAFIRIVTERKLVGFFAVIIASFPFYPFAQVRAHAAFFGGDGPHIVSLTFIPLALGMLLRFIQKGKITYFFYSSILFALVLLISAFGYMNLLLFAGLICFSEMLLGNGRLKVSRLLVVVVASYALTAFWYNPGLLYWMIASPFGDDVRYMIQRLIPISMFSVPVLAVFGYLLFDRKPDLQPVFLASFFSICFAIIALSGGGVFPGSPSRYVAEFGLSLAFLASIVIVKLADYAKFLDNPRLRIGNKHIRLFIKPQFINGILVLLFGASLWGIIIGRGNISTNQEKVLGIWTGVERSEVWAKRETFGFASSAVGYAITGVSVAGYGFLGLKIKDNDKEEKK